MHIVRMMDKFINNLFLIASRFFSLTFAFKIILTHHLFQMVEQGYLLKGSDDELIFGLYNCYVVILSVCRRPEKIRKVLIT